jgi:hypothetical protein
MGAESEHCCLAVVSRSFLRDGVSCYNLDLAFPDRIREPINSEKMCILHNREPG